MRSVGFKVKFTKKKRNIPRNFAAKRNFSCFQIFFFPENFISLQLVNNSMNKKMNNEFFFFMKKNQVEWFFKNEQIVYDSRIVKHTSGQTHSLVIRNVRAQDYGYYLCRAANYLGTREKVIELSGVANPAVIKGSRSVGKNAYYFVWEVDSYSSIIEYQFWFRNYPVSFDRRRSQLFGLIGYSEALSRLKIHFSVC